VKDKTFLAAPLSEQGIANALGANKSAVHEVVLGFVQSGWLIRPRAGDGILREEFDSPRLVELFALRRYIERGAIREVLDSNRLRRGAIADRLKDVIVRQRQLVASEDEDDKFEWFNCSVKFHVGISREADFRDLAMSLETLLWKLRIGMRVDIDNAKLREKATGEHEAIIQGIRDGRLKVDQFIADHIYGPMSRAVARAERSKPHPAPDEEVEKGIKTRWDIFLERFGDSAAEAQTNL
jgi:DNA-binding GntR family transcriptional regulator